MPPRLSLRAPTSRALTLALPLRPPRTRPFFTLPGSAPKPQVLTASRILPYAPAPLYEIIADVGSYSTFVPYCSASDVTHWSPPDPQGRRWPTRATLRVGWGGFEESFTSRVTCVPSSLVEAVSGEAAGFGGGGSAASVLKNLVTRWSFAPAPAPALGTPRGLSGEEVQRARVSLRLEFEFANPLYAAVSAAVSETVAASMIQAFEEHAQKVLGKGTPLKAPL